jgi:hypothetical protein
MAGGLLATQKKGFSNNIRNAQYGSRDEPNVEDPRAV